ncbi:MAG: ribonuclease HI, partial [Proteobacteria bacterium]
NNRMELQAVIGGLKLLREPCSVHIIVDSRYVMDAFEKGWIRTWKANGWKTASKQAVKNQDLWEQLDSAVSPHRIRWEWVKGHNGHPDNERVDVEVQAQARRAKESGSSGNRIEMLF